MPGLIPCRSATRAPASIPGCAISAIRSPARGRCSPSIGRGMLAEWLAKARRCALVCNECRSSSRPAGAAARSRRRRNPLRPDLDGWPWEPGAWQAYGVGSGQGVPLLGPTRVMSALRAWPLPNLPRILSYNHGICEHDQRLPARCRGGPGIFHRNFPAARLIAAVPGPNISGLPGRFFHFCADQTSAGSRSLARGPRLHPTHPPDRGHRFPGSHGPPGPKVNVDWLMGRYHRLRRGASRALHNRGFVVR
jgi:hypothetical protein